MTLEEIKQTYKLKDRPLFKNKRNRYYKPSKFQLWAEYLGIAFFIVTFMVAFSIYSACFQ